MPAHKMTVSAGAWTSYELFWVNIQPILLKNGYQLRPRYHPEWKPSWLQPECREKWYDCEDSINAMSVDVLDAIRIEDGSKVVLKRIVAESKEYQIASHLSTPKMRLDPRNRAVPVIDIIPLTDHENPNHDVLLVMPYLRTIEKPRFHCRGEVVDAFHQFLQGLAFLHEHSVAHRHITICALMMDESALSPEGSHFCRPWTHNGFQIIRTWRDRCTVAPVHYYFIGFGSSIWHPNKRNNVISPRPLRQRKMFLEPSDTTLSDPYKDDVYQLGRTLLEVITPYKGLDAFIPLCQRMMLSSIDHRPTALDALAQLEVISSEMSPALLKTRIHRDENRWSVWKRDTRSEGLLPLMFPTRTIRLLLITLVSCVCLILLPGWLYFPT